MNRKPLTTYKQKPRHLCKNATEAISIRALPAIKNNVKEIAEIFGTSMTSVIIKALSNYFELMEVSGVIGNGVHDLDSAVACAERIGG